MSRLTRSSSNPPPYYHQMDKKQQKNWMKATKKMERNEQLRMEFPPFRASSNINVIHIHHLTTITMINDLIIKAKQTRTYVLDTESAKGQSEEQGALIQLQLIHSINHSTLILIETDYLPNAQSILFTKIKELCGIIFSNNNKIITWGNIEKEFEHFHHLDIIHIGKINEVNLQSLFRRWHDGHQTHPTRERRDGMNDGMDDDDNYFGPENPVENDMNTDWSLQEATKEALGRFLDKSLTVNHWKCGLDLNLGKWKTKLFSRRQYNVQEEKQQRINMKQYAVDDCAVVTEIYFHMYPAEIDSYRAPALTTTTRTRTVITDIQDDLSDISEEELIEILKPKFNKQRTTTTTTANDDTKQVYYELSDISEDGGELLLCQSNEPSTTSKQPEKREQKQEEQRRQQSKTEKQRQKNKKLKWKQQNHPDFQNKIKRPIYHRYDYRKIRAQMLQDDIFTSHQVTINRARGETMIGFKTKEEHARATRIMKINYFSREEYYERWG